MDFEKYCKTLEENLNENWNEIHRLEDRVKELEALINNASDKLKEYYQQQKDNKYFSNEGKRLICRVIENCQKIVQGTFEL